MRILICSHSFSPNVGGLETVGRLLAEEFVAAGHEIRVCTRTPGAPETDLGLTVIRNPSSEEFRRQVKWANVVLQNNISLPWALPLVFMRKPWVCGNHDWPRSDDGSLSWKGRLKLRVASLARAQTACSRVLAGQLLGKPVVVGNPYDGAFFRGLPDVPRDRDIVFLGRLYEGKGVDTLLRAAAIMRAERPGVSVTVIGRGPAEQELRGLCSKLDLDGNVAFRGPLFGDELISELNRHVLCVVPSRSRESFGIVALEAMACGCVVIGSDHGGVPEAVGEGGPIFPTGDFESLAGLATRLLAFEAELDAQRIRQTRHLDAYSSRTVARHYLDLLTRVATPDTRKSAL